MSLKIRFKKGILVSAIACLVAVPGVASAENIPLADLMKIDSDALDKSEYKKFISTSSEDLDHRLQAVKGAAKMVGAQHGYNERMKARQAELRAKSEYMDRIWDFRTLMTLASSNQNGKYLIPAIMAESEGVKALTPDANTIVISEREYQIIRPARLTLRAPHWKGYLLGGADMETNLPSELLIPKDEKEKKVWEDGVSEGWVAGQNMAEREIITRMTRMKQDFLGIAKNIRLTMQNKLRQTLVTYDFEMSKGGGSRLAENQHVFRIAAPASLNGEVSEWKPIIMDARDSLYFPLEGGVYVDPLGRVE